MRFPASYTIPEHGSVALLKKERFGLQRDAHSRIQKDGNLSFFVYKNHRYVQSKKGSRLFRLVKGGSKRSKRSKTYRKSKNGRIIGKRSKPSKSKKAKKSKLSKKTKKSKSSKGKKSKRSGKKSKRSGSKKSKKSGSKKSKRSGSKKSKRSKSSEQDGKIYKFEARIDFLNDHSSRKPSKEDIRREMHKLRRIIRRELKGVATVRGIKNLQVEFDNNDPQYVKVLFLSDEDKDEVQVTLDMLKDFDDDGNYPVRIGEHEYLLRLQ